MPDTPEEIARATIDGQLAAAGWGVQDVAEINLSAARGVAIRELRSQGGPADYILFVDGKALGVLEAKKEGTTLSSVADQSARYSHARKWIPQRWADPLPFTYESTGVETNFRDVLSQLYFEQMKGRGTRTVDPSDLATVTPLAKPQISCN